MADTYHFSLERPHLNMSPNNSIEELTSTPASFSTFTALLNAAHSAEVDTSPATTNFDAVAVPAVPSVAKRRLRNSESCRKTRLKRKLQQHALNLLVHERQARNEYLKKVSCELGLDHGSREGDHDELFREFAVKSLHYALVDHEYIGWQDENNDNGQVSSTAGKRKREPTDHPATSRSTRLRRSFDRDVSTAPRSNSATAQDSLIKQWQPLVDGLQNVDLKLHRMEEIDIGAGAFERRCHWKFVGVNSVETQRDGNIAAVAVSGTTHVKFQGVRVQDVNICVVRRETNVAFDSNPRTK